MLSTSVTNRCGLNMFWYFKPSCGGFENSGAQYGSESVILTVGTPKFWKPPHGHSLKSLERLWSRRIGSLGCIEVRGLGFWSLKSLEVLSLGVVRPSGVGWVSALGLPHEATACVFQATAHLFPSQIAKLKAGFGVASSKVPKNGPLTTTYRFRQ